MPIWLIVTIVVAGFIGLLYLGIKLRHTTPLGVNVVKETQAIVDSLVVHTNTPKGVFVLSQKTMAPEAITAIDEEFDNMFQIAQRLGYSNKLQHSLYTVLVFPSVKDYDSSGTYSPSFKVYFEAGNAYDETIWDQMPNYPGGWTYAAEWVMDLDQCRFVIADNNSIEYTKNVIHYGLDHLLPYHNDRAFYEATKSHAQGQNPHPILT